MLLWEGVHEADLYYDYDILEDMSRCLCSEVYFAQLNGIWATCFTYVYFSCLLSRLMLFSYRIRIRWWIL